MAAATFSGAIPLGDLAGHVAFPGRRHRGIRVRCFARLLFGTVNSIVEWYRPAPAEAGGAGPASVALADAVCAITFDRLRVRR